MGKKAIFVSILSFLLILGVAMPELCLGYHGDLKSHKRGFENKISRKAGKILRYKDELGLSADQVTKVKSLKNRVRKDLIRRDAEIDMLKVDIKDQMCADPINKEALTKLIEQKYDLKKKKTLYLVDEYSNLKNVLNKEQKAKMKKLYKKSVKKHMHEGMMDSPEQPPIMRDR